MCWLGKTNHHCEIGHFHEYEYGWIDCGPDDGFEYTLCPPGNQRMYRWAEDENVRSVPADECLVCQEQDEAPKEFDEILSKYQYFSRHKAFRVEQMEEFEVEMRQKQSERGRLRAYEQTERVQDRRLEIEHDIAAIEDRKAEYENAIAQDDEQLRRIEAVQELGKAGFVQQRMRNMAYEVRKREDVQMLAELQKPGFVERYRWKGPDKPGPPEPEYAI